MSGIVSGVGGLLGLLGAGPGGSPITPVNPFQPFPLVTPAGAAGSLAGIGLDPEEQALVDFLGGEQDVRTRDIYARLGLGGSTMEAQDLGANELQRLAESASLISGNRAQAIQEQQVAGTQQQQEAALAAQTALTTQQQQITAQQNAFTQGQTSLSNLAKAFTNLGSGAGSAAAAAAPA